MTSHYVINLNEGRGKGEPVEDVFLHILFLKLHSSSQGDWLMEISQLNNLILQSIQAWYVKTLTPYANTMAAPVCVTYRSESYSILKSIIRNLL